MSEADKKIERVKVRPRPVRSARPAQAAAPPPAEEPSEFEASMASTVQAIVAAEKGARDKKTAAEALERIKELVAGMSDEAFWILSGNEDFQKMTERVAATAGDAPGTPTYDANGRQIGYVPFTYQWFCDNHEMEWYIPRRNNNSVGINGVEVSLFEGVRVYLPKPFIDLEENSLRAEADAVRRQKEIMDTAPSRYADETTLGVGWYKETPEELERAYGVER